MPEVSGDFEVHITVDAHAAERLAGFAAERAVKFVHIVLDRGAYASREAGIYPCRSKIEAAPWCAGVPRSDEQAAAEPAGRYFEHHIKLLLPSVTVTDLVALTDLVAPHGARLSRNARWERPNGAQERFVNQRCHGVGLATAKRRLDALVEALRAAGYEISAVEQEYVVFDSGLQYDRGWLDPAGPEGWMVEREDRMRSAPAGSPEYPPNYQPLPADPAVRQRAAFDPALKQYPNAYRAGDPS